MPNKVNLGSTVQQLPVNQEATPPSGEELHFSGGIKAFQSEAAGRTVSVISFYL